MMMMMMMMMMTMTMHLFIHTKQEVRVLSTNDDL
jgi:hypothetical protein